MHTEIPFYPKYGHGTQPGIEIHRFVRIHGNKKLFTTLLRVDVIKSNRRKWIYVTQKMIYATRTFTIQAKENSGPAYIVEWSCYWICRCK